jgi:predicted nucleotidyltransferase
LDIYTEERRGDLRRLELSSLREHLRAALSAYPEVKGAYLFGSAREAVRPTSDIDIGLILGEGLDTCAAETVAGKVEAGLGRWGPHPFHVTVLRARDLNFTFRVLRDGELVYASDLESVTDLIEVVGRRHEDLTPFRETFDAALGFDPG